MIRVRLPYHLQTLARVGREVSLEVQGEVSLASVLDALEAAYPSLCGTVRNRSDGQRRPLIRFFALENDLSLQPTNLPLPARIASGEEPLLIVGAIAGG